MKLGEHGLGGYGFGILSIRIQVQTVGNLAIGSIELSVVRLICFGALVCCGFFVVFVCFSLSVAPRVKMRFLSM